MAPISRRFLALCIVLGAAVLRLGIIILVPAPSPGDLDIYYESAGIVRDGGNPYSDDTSLTSSARHRDNPPLELWILGMGLRLMDREATIRLLFAVGDMVALLAIARLGKAPPLRLMAFYGFCPALLIVWTVEAGDKGWILAGLVMLIGGLSTSIRRQAIGAALASCVKWAALPALPLLAILWWRNARVRGLAWLMATALGIALPHLAFLPDVVTAYATKADRVSFGVPQHGNLFTILWYAGLYRPWLPAASMVAAMGALYYAWKERRLNTPMAIIGLTSALFLLQPEASAGRFLLLGMLLLCVRRIPDWRWVWLVGTAWAVLFAYYRGILPLGPEVQASVRPWLATYGGARHALTNLLLPVTLWFATAPAPGKVGPPASLAVPSEAASFQPPSSAGRREN